VKAALLAIALLTAAVSPAAVGKEIDLLQEIEVACAEQWPGDYRMQEHCQQKEIEGMRQITGFMDRHGMQSGKGLNERYQKGDSAATIYIKCAMKWPRTQPSMRAHCIGKEEEAAQRLGKLQ
jgi:hypothetical protein